MLTRWLPASARAFLLVLALALLTVPTRAYAAPGGECISELAIGVGQDGVAQLERDGYTVMSRPICQGGEAYLGYKYGGSPVTGITIGGGNGGLSSNGVTYDLVADVDVCAGVKGASYVYATHDAAAGTGIVSVSLVEGGGHVDDASFAIRNDGLVPARDDAGHVADLGVDAPTYLLLLRKEVCRPYIRDARPVSGPDLRGAVLVAANEGFNCYYDTGLTTTEGAYVVIGYNRTQNADEALTCITARPAGEDSYQVANVAFERMGDVLLAGDSPYRLFCTRDKAAGNPIIDLTGSGVPARATDVMGKWVQRTFAKFVSALAANEVKGEELYGRLLASKDELANVAVVMAGQSAVVSQQTSAPQGSEAAASTTDGADAPQGSATQDDQEVIELGESSESQPAPQAQQQEQPDAQGAAASNAQSSVEAVKTPLAYVCVAAGMPESLFAQPAGAPAGDGAQGNAAQEKDADSASQDVVHADSSDSNSVEQDGDVVELADDFDSQTYLEEQAVIIAEDDVVELVASAFGNGAGTTLAVAGGMAVVGALAGFAIYRLKRRRESSDSSEQSTAEGEDVRPAQAPDEKPGKEGASDDEQE